MGVCCVHWCSCVVSHKIRNGHCYILRKLNTKPFPCFFCSLTRHPKMETRSGIPLGTKPQGNHPVSWNDDEQILVCLPTIVQILVMSKVDSCMPNDSTQPYRFAFAQKVPSLIDITQDEDPYLRIGVRPLKDIPCTPYNDTEGTQWETSLLNTSIKDNVVHSPSAQSTRLIAEQYRSATWSPTGLTSSGG